MKKTFTRIIAICITIAATIGLTACNKKIQYEIEGNYNTGQTGLHRYFSLNGYNHEDIKSFGYQYIKTYPKEVITFHNIYGYWTIEDIDPIERKYHPQAKQWTIKLTVIHDSSKANPDQEYEATMTITIENEWDAQSGAPRFETSREKWWYEAKTPWGILTRTP
jgi:hypothetical protein